MTGIAQVQHGKLFRGRLTFAAETEKTLQLNKGGSWAPGSYSAQPSFLMPFRDTYEVTTVTDSTAYFVTYDGVLYSITSDGSATAAEIRDALIAKILLTSPGNGLTAGIVDGTHFYVAGLVGGVYHVRGAASTGTGLLTPANGDLVVPANTIFQESGQVRVRFAAAFTGHVDLLLAGI